MARITSSAEPFLPEHRSIGALRAAAAACRGCPLYLHATQTVFGEGKVHAALMLVGEQPGDREDLEGRPFVGPAGMLLDRALIDAGIDRAQAYVTNAVKHFKWTRRGKRRLHQKPAAGEVKACHPWLEAEIAAIAPTGIVALGATALLALAGASARVMRDRGTLIRSPLAGWILPTVHPSALLRLDGEDRDAGYRDFVADLVRAADALAHGSLADRRKAGA